MARPRNILYVESSSGTVGGSMISLLELVRHTDPGRFRPHVLLFDDPEIKSEFVAAGARVVTWDEGEREERPRDKAVHRVKRIPGLGRLYHAAAGARRLWRREWPLARRLAGLVRELDCDLLHANDRIGSNGFVIHAARFSGRPVLVHERLIYPFAWEDRLASRRVDVLCCISEAVRRSAESQGARPRRWEVLHNPVASPDSGRKPGPVRHVIFVGRLVPWKGPDRFIEACGLLAEAHPDLRFSVVGAEDPGEPAYAGRLRERAEQLGLGGRIVFTGAVRDMHNVFARADALVHASVTPEPFGRVVAEAMAHGLAVIASDAGGPRELIEDGVTGLLVPPASPEAIAAAVRDLLQDPARASELGRRAREAVRRDLDPGEYAGRIADLHEEMIRGRA